MLYSEGRLPELNGPKIKFFISSVGESIAYAVHGVGLVGEPFGAGLAE